MRRGIFILVMLAGLFISRPVQAQSGVVIDNLEIGLWPEYDRSDVLVIYRITLAADTALPAQMNLRIPRAAGAPYNLAMKDMDGLLYNLPYTSEEQNDWLRITFTTPSASLQLEYYDPGLTKTGAERRYEYVWNGDFKVNHLAVAVQQPTNAAGMQILPDFGASITGEDGLNYYTKDVGSVNSGTTFTVGFVYTKPDDSLSFGSQSVQPVQAAATPTAGQASVSGVLPYILGGIGLLFVIGGLVWFIVSRNQQGKTSRRSSRHRRSVRPQPVSAPTSGDPVFCSKCGRRAAPSDLFCRACGSRLRTE